MQILGKEEMPSLEEVISIIMSEESRRAIMLEPQVLEGSTLTIRTEQMKALENGRMQPRAKLTRISDNGRADHTKVSRRDNRDNQDQICSVRG